MAVMRVSSSEFRVKMKDLANAVDAEQHRIVVTRHGGRMMVVVSQEDYEFLQKHKPQPTPRLVPEPVPDITEGIDEPSSMKTADIERIYAATKDSTDEYIQRWRERANVELLTRAYFERARARSAAERAPKEENQS